MSFANPLAFAFFLVAVPILILYLFRIRRRPEEIPSLALWRRLVKESEFTSLLRKLRRILSLLLQMAIAAAIILALAKPELDLSGIQGRSLAILLDDSASMMTSEEGGSSRFDIAIDRARQIVEERGVLDEVMIVLGSARTKVASPFTRDRRRLGEILDALRPRPLSSNLGAAHRLAADLMRGRKSPEIVVISDGASGQIREILSTSEYPVHYFPVGTTSDNVGIVRFRARKNISLGTDTIHAEVLNACAEPRTLSMELRVNGETRKVIPVEMEPGAIHKETLDLALPDGGVLDLELDVQDALSIDDRAWAVVPPQKPQRILMVIPEGRDFFLRAACESMDEVVDIAGSRIVTPEAFAALSPEERGMDALIFQDRLPEEVPTDGNLLFIHVSGEGIPFRLEREEILPNIRDWSETHPINRMIQWKDLSLPRAFPVKGSGVEMLLESFGGGLVAATSDADRRAVYIGFDVLEADFPFRLAFPVLLRNILAWFHEEEARIFQDVYAPGDIIAPLRDLPGDISTGTITFPGEGEPERRTLPVEEGRFRFDETLTCGPYRIVAGPVDAITCVNLEDPAESRVAPSLEATEGALTEASLLLHREFWRAFAVAALALILLEWALFQRRITD